MNWERIAQRIMDCIEYGRRTNSDDMRVIWYREACGMLAAFGVLRQGFPELDACLEARRMIYG